MGKLCLNTVNSNIFVYTCVILTSIIHVFSKDATCIQSFYWIFIDVFCMYVDFYFLSFRHFNTGAMTLPTDIMWQCHPHVVQCMKVDTKVIPHAITCQILPNYTFIFNLFMVMFYTLC